MPWNVSWLDAEESIVTYEPVDPWTWEEFVEAIRQGQTMIREKEYIVDTVYQLHPPIVMPSANALGYFREVYATDPKNSGMNAVIGANPYVQTLVGIITAVMGGTSRFRFVSNMDEALAAIEEVRSGRATGT